MTPPPQNNSKSWWEFTTSAIVDANGERWHYPTVGNSDAATGSADQDATMAELPVHAPIDGDDDPGKGGRDPTKGLSQPTEAEPTQQTNKQRETPGPGTPRLHTGLWQPPKKEPINKEPHTGLWQPTNKEPSKKEPAKGPESQWETPLPETYRRPTRRRHPPLTLSSEPTGLWKPPPAQLTRPSGLWKPSKGRSP